MLYAYAIRYASRCSASLVIVSLSYRYRIVSYRIVLRTPHTYTHADYACTYMRSDRHTHMQSLNIIARTIMPRHTKSRNVLRFFFFKPGGGSNQIHFPFGNCC